MPAVSSCPIALPTGSDDLALDAVIAGGPSLLQALRTVPDPRSRRGVRHQSFTVLTLAVCAMLTGARGYAAIWRWSAQTLPATRTAMGIEGPIPCGTTIRRTLQSTDPTASNVAVARWLAAHLEHLQQLRDRPPNASATLGEEKATGSTAPAVIAVDGKTVRGSRSHNRPATHLLAAFDTTHGIVLGQVDVNAKTNEITYQHSSPNCVSADSCPMGQSSLPMPCTLSDPPPQRSWLPGPTTS